MKELETLFLKNNKSLMLMMKKHFTKKKLIILGIIATVVVIFLVRSWPLPDLGPKLHYFGKSTYGGCLLTYCVRESHNYYFSTNMSEEELQNYFKPARFSKESRRVVDWNEDTPNYIEWGYDISKDEGFGLQYYEPENAMSTAKYYGLKDPDGRALMLISDLDYEVAKRMFSR